MQLSLAVVLLAVVIASVTCSPTVPILSYLSNRNVEVPQSAQLLRSSARLIRLPARQLQQPDSVYGVYAPPEVTTEEEELLTTTTTTEIPTTTENILEQVKAEEGNDQDEKFDEEGVYFIYHPDGLLQRVAYGTRVEDMGYSARLTYKDVQPIKEPIYTYDPKTLVFSQIQF